jgi:hypothetical protein
MKRQTPHEPLKAEPRVIDRVDEAVDWDEVLRYLGYPAGVSPSDRIESVLDRWIAEASLLAAPRATYLVLPVEHKDRKCLRVRSVTGITEFRGAIGEFLGISRSVAAFISTAGPDVESLATELLRNKDDLAAMIVSAVGAERAEAAEAEVLSQLREEFRPVGLAPTLPYSPGYCGMALTEQTKLFSLFRDHDVGVTLTSDCLMQPIKSISGLIGLGLATDVEEFSSPCDRCEMYNCNMRR